MPLPVNLGGKEGYLVQIRLMMEGAGARAAVGPKTLVDFLEEASHSAHWMCVEVFDFETLAGIAG